MTKAIIGMAARFANGASFSDYWEMLKEQGTLVRPMGKRRRVLAAAGASKLWSASDDVQGMYFDDIDCFDRGLFGLSAPAAAFADPRQRMLLEAAWRAIEDAGLCSAALAGKKVGVFIAHDGWYLDSYLSRIAPGQLTSSEFVVPGNDPCFLANRISAVFNFTGPSVVLDTTCSGTYVALHQACLALDSGECDYALVGAVTLFLDPWLDGAANATPFESALPGMRSFCADAGGYHTSEGCGAVLLCGSVRASAAGHSVYGQLHGSGHNSGGKTASFAQPSQAQQTRLFRETLAQAGVQPAQVDYVEAHGVASLLGDAIEANALIEVFGRQCGHCHVSTIKPNMGHSHAASGIYSLLKALLCLRHDAIPPVRGLAGSRVNEAIAADTRGLRFLTEFTSWPRRADGAPRFAFLSSYGFSNVNAALVLGEAIGNGAAPAQYGAQALVCVSAQSGAQLLEQLSALRDYALSDEGRQADCHALAHTLQSGRAAMEWRWAAAVDSTAHLADLLEGVLVRGEDGLSGPVSAGRAQLAAARPDCGGDEASTIETPAHWEVSALARLWQLGANIDWTGFYPDGAPGLLHLPGYPFARERYWIALAAPIRVAPVDAAPAPASSSLLHPLVHSNTSSLAVHRFSSHFSGEEFFFADHVIQGRRLLPAVAQLEMVHAAIGLSTGRQGAQELVLNNVVWTRPVVGGASGASVDVLLHADGEGGMVFALQGGDGDAIAFSEGRARWRPAQPGALLDLAVLQARMRPEAVGGDAFYRIPPRLELYLGSRMQGVSQVFTGEREVLGRLVLPAAHGAGMDAYALHPAMTDPLLQLAYLALIMPLNAHLPLTIPFSLEQLRVCGPCSASMWTWIRYAPHSGPGDAVQVLDLDLCHDDGSICLQMRGFSFRAIDSAALTAPQAAAAAPAAVAAGPLQAAAVAYLKSVLAPQLHVAPQDIGADAALEEFGIDSILAVKLTKTLEQDFGSLPKTLFFEYLTLAALAAYLLAEHGQRARELLSPALRQDRIGQVAPACFPEQLPLPDAAAKPAALDIAIIGLAGRYPLADNLAQFWEVLRDGTDCVCEVPAERWDWREHYSADRSSPGKHYSKWGGFLRGIDRFDALFFNIAPSEAQYMDPQERLFLEHAWAALEDAGYCRAAPLSEAAEARRPGERAVGVYAGVMYGEYQLFGVQGTARGAQAVGFAGTLATIANRVSYLLDLHGPSMTVDTMCSSSMTALHLACQDLRLGGTDLALAGGVNLSLHPNKYLELSRRQFVSSTGRCESFGAGGDGYVPGEGVGVAVLKRLADAERDGDHIYGVIKGSALNHGGKTNGYTVPNPAAQQAVVGAALLQAGLDADDIGYVEAHGTGTRLGDPIEIAGLSKAFGGSAGPMGYCPIGSVKSNIGHCEAAAGIAGLSKILLQLQHHAIAPSLHASTLNANIDFATTPFEVSQQLRAWQPGPERLRSAGLSSFGAGGANGHMVIQEHRATVPALASAAPQTLASPVMVLLSARNSERLRVMAAQLLAFVEEQAGPIDLAALACTLQLGRDALEERLGLLCSSAGELAGLLRQYVDGTADVAGLHTGRAGTHGELLAWFGGAGALDPVVDGWIAQRDGARLLSLWVRGYHIDWRRCYGAGLPGRISLPTYPFARTRHWFDPVMPPGAGMVGGHLHPLLHRNTSSLSGLRFVSTFDGTEDFLDHHRVQGRKILPAVVQLAMARAALCMLNDGVAQVSLHEVAWLSPIVVADEPCEVQLTFLPLASDHSRLRFEISTGAAAERLVHAQGYGSAERLELAPPPLAALRAALEVGPTLAASDCYAAFEQLGFGYGGTHRCLGQVLLGEQQVLARLHLAPYSPAPGHDLHPGLLDAALQAALVLELAVGGRLVVAADASPLLPFTLLGMEVTQPVTGAMWAWVRRGSGQAGAAGIDIDVCDDAGVLSVALRGLCSRRAVGATTLPALPMAQSTLVPPSLMLATPVWTAAPVAMPQHLPARRAVLVCAPCAGLTEQLAILLAGWSCHAMPALQGANACADPDDYARRASQLLAIVNELQASRAPDETLLVQLLVPDNALLLGGLGGLLRSAARELPGFHGQLIQVAPGQDAGQLAAIVRENAASPRDDTIRQLGGVREVRSWRLRETTVPGPAPWRSGGVYLITGGLGALGTALARNILDNAPGAVLILAGRSAPDGALGTALARLQAHGAAGGAEVRHAVLDVANAQQVQSLIDDIVGRHGALHGIFHCAGILDDGPLQRKSATAIARVLAPKVAGALHLDAATRALGLDLFVLYASVAGALGNAGQADYACANAFLDQFAQYRNALVASGQRQGRTLALDWPLWEGGGMQVSAGAAARIAAEFGMYAMPEALGLEALRQALAGPDEQLLVIYGNTGRIRQVLAPALSALPALPALPALSAPQPVSVDSAREGDSGAVELVRTLLSALLKMPLHLIGNDDLFEQAGADSVAVLALVAQLEKTYGPLPKALPYEYPTVNELAAYLDQHAAPLTVAPAPAAVFAPAPALPQAPTLADLRAVMAPRAASAPDEHTIAIIGISGRYPQADDLDQFWRNLAEGRDCVTEVPAERWDWREFSGAAPAPGGHGGKWGGFIDGADHFDAAFFDIPARTAALMDPQERLFLEQAWSAMEDAGYTRAALERPDAPAGVYAGVMCSDYRLFGVQADGPGTPRGFAGSPASVANRVSFALNLHGPSMTLDTMCSSSLSAIHLACQALRQHDIGVGIAGGVNLSLHPNKYVMLSEGGYLSPASHCASFGPGGSGYVPGEGVGVVILKRLADAERDGDHIHALIRGSAISHAGRGNGYGSPSPVAQRSTVAQALRDARVAAHQIGYVEAHGTGTLLGDPIEIAALTHAFHARADAHPDPADGSLPPRTGYCAIGSAKSNIGHCEAAAGIAGLSKVVLQMRHQQLAPSLHASEGNPHIDFASTPFVVNHALRDWERPVGQAHASRLAGLSAFGAGGANAHLVLEEYRAAASEAADPPGGVLIVLSARGQDALRRLAAKLAAWLGRGGHLPCLDRLAWTLQSGREAWESRLAFVALSLAEVGDRLQRYADGAADAAPLGGAAGSIPGGIAADEDMAGLIATYIAKNKLARLGELWTGGLAIDWRKLYAHRPVPRRAALPAYPFTPTTHWWSQPSAPSQDRQGAAVAPPAPLRARQVAAAASVAETLDDLLAFLMSNVLDRDLAPDARDGDLAALGLQSVQVASFLAAWRAAVGTALPPALLYEAASLRTLRDLILEQGQVSAAALAQARAAIAGRHDMAAVPGAGFALSDMQQALVVGRHVPTLGFPVSSTIYFELEAAETIVPQRLEQAWNALIGYHASLRTVVGSDSLQRVLAQVPPYVIACSDLAVLDEAARRTALDSVYAAMAGRSFTLSEWPCFEVRISLLDGARALIHIALDEAFADGYSANLLARQLHGLYRDPAHGLPALESSYEQMLAQGAAAEATPAFAESLDYWRAKLAGMPAGPLIAAGRSSAAPHCLGGQLAPERWRSIKDLAARLGCYPSTVLLAVFCRALAGSAVDPARAFSMNMTNLNRLALQRDAMRLTGLFINSSIVLVDPLAGAPFADLVCALQAQLEADAPHAHVGAVRMLRELKRAGEAGASASPVVFTSMISAIFDASPDALWTVGRSMNSTPQVHLDHQVFERGGALCYNWYVADGLIAAGEVQQVFAQYGRLLEALSTEPGACAAAELPFALTNQQAAYAFGRSVSYGHGGKGCVFHTEYDIDALDVARLQLAWNRLTAHHPMLRATILSHGQQRILAQALWPSEPEVLCQDAASFEAQCRRLREAMLATVYPLDSAPFHRLCVCRLQGGPGRVFINIDLMIADGNSLMLLMEQLFALYADPNHCLAEPAMQFRDYVLLRESERVAPAFFAAQGYWRDKFARLAPGPDLPGLQRSARASNIQISRILPLQRALRDKARRLGVGMGAVLLAAYGQTLLEWNGHRPFSLVCVHWDRDAALGIDAVVGDFTRLSWVAFGPAAADADQAIQRVQQQLLRDADHRAADGIEVLRQHKGMSFPVVFTDLPQVGSAGPGAGVQAAYTVSHTPQVVLDSISGLIGDEGLKLQWDTLIDADGAESAMFERYVALLQQWLTDRALGEVEALPVTLPAAGVTLPQLFEAMVARYPQAEALRFDGQSMSYRQLEQASAQAAHWLQAAGARPDSVVALFMERSAELMVSLVGILRAGASYLPLDVGLPAQRIDLILADAGVSCVFTQRKFAHLWEGRAGLRVCIADDVVAAPQPPVTPAPGFGEASLAYVIYTSGSTGAPKGCMIEHRSIVNRLAWMQQQFLLRPGERVLQKTPYSFDVSVWELVWPLLVGATVVLARPGGHLDGDYLLGLIERERIAMSHFVPSMLRSILQERDVQRMAGLRHVFVSGEALEYDLFEAFSRHFAIPLENLYGPTEAAVDVSWWRCRHNRERKVSIGKAISGIGLHVLDEAMQPVSDGETGELYISGVGVGRGYLNNPALSGAAFLPAPFDHRLRLYRTGDLALRTEDGNLLFLGRKDSQVKLNGLRIELEEIEHHLRAHAGVADAIVDVRPFRGQKVLVAWVVPSPAAGSPPGEQLAAFLRQRLPRYMVPQLWQTIGALPLTQHGKRNRSMLLTPTQEGAVAAPAVALQLSALERRLATMVTELRAARISKDNPIAKESV